MKGSIFERIAALDADRDHQEIYRLSTVYEFPSDTRRALEFALFRTFAVPSIAGILHRSGVFELVPEKRYRATDAALYEIIRHGYTSPQGRAAIARINCIHRRFAISNDDMLYVLSVFILEPIRWNRAFGWRQLTSAEKRAALRFWSEVGDRLGIRDIPQSEVAVKQYNRSYEKNRFEYSAAGRSVADRTLDLLVGTLAPKPLWPFVYPLFYAVMDEPLRVALGYPTPSAWLRALVWATLRLHRRYMLSVSRAAATARFFAANVDCRR